MATKDYYTSSTSIGSVRARSIYRMSDAQPDWAEKDPSQPDYIKNKELAERFRPVSVNGEEVLDDSYRSGNLNLVGGDNVDISVENGSIKISAKVPETPDIPSAQDTDTVRPIYVNGEKILGDNTESGELNLVSGKNVTLAVEGNKVVISASGGGSPEGGGDCPEYVEGDGINITENIYGQREISIETGAISDDMISSVSIEKITNADGIKLILNGGNANG
jgi:antitoxin component of MazEF toxin-antitoxin module